MTNHRERTASGVGLIESELGESTRSLLRAAREGDQPSAADRARVRQALAVALAAGAAGAAGATTAGASTAASAAAGKAAAAGLGGAGMSTTAAATTAAAGTVATTAAGTATTAGGLATAGLLTKVAVAVVAIGVGSGAVVATGRLWTARTEPAPVVEAAASDATAIEHASVHAAARARTTDIAPAVGAEAMGEAAVDTIEAPVAAPVAVIEAPAESPRAPIAAPVADGPVARPRRAAAPAPTASAEDEASVAEETLLIARAQRRGAAASERLEAIDAYDARFPHGQMVEERNRAERRAIGDLCAEGETAVQAFLAAHPSGTSASHVRAHCDGE